MVLSGLRGWANAPPAAVRAKFQGEFLDSSVDFDVDRLALPCSCPHGLIVSDDITGRLAISAAPQLVSGVVSDGIPVGGVFGNADDCSLARDISGVPR